MPRIKNCPEKPIGFDPNKYNRISDVRQIRALIWSRREILRIFETDSEKSKALIDEQINKPDQVPQCFQLPRYIKQLTPQHSGVISPTDSNSEIVLELDKVTEFDCSIVDQFSVNDFYHDVTAYLEPNQPVPPDEKLLNLSEWFVTTENSDLKQDDLALVYKKDLDIKYHLTDTEMVLKIDVSGPLDDILEYVKERVSLKRSYLGERQVIDKSLKVYDFINLKLLEYLDLIVYAKVYGITFTQERLIEMVKYHKDAKSYRASVKPKLNILLNFNHKNPQVFLVS